MGERPSIASVVPSLDRYSAKYVARVVAQKASSDIQKLPHMLRELFLAFYKSTSRKPEHVIYHRDGVSEGQYYVILQAEMRALRKACKMISEGNTPSVTFTIVNKRHHARTFPVNQRDADCKGNAIHGTVVDSGVVNPHRFDFFLYGHRHDRAGHYTVLHDENMLAKDIQRLTYYLCYTFSRCNRSVSLPSPVQYAQLAAKRADIFLSENSDGASSFKFTNVHNNGLRDTT